MKALRRVSRGSLKASRGQRLDGRFPSSSAASKRTPGAGSARRVLSVLDVFGPSRPRASIDDLVQALGVPRSTVYRYTSLLREFGFLVEVDAGVYSLGPRIVGLGRAAQAAIDHLDIARPVMERLVSTTEETVFMFRRIGENAICTERLDAPHPVRCFVEVSTRIPMPVVC